MVVEQKELFQSLQIIIQPRDHIRNEKRSELDLAESDIVVISAGDLIERKNYKTAIKAIAKTGLTNVHYFICGKGPQEEELKDLAKELGIESQVHMLGFRTDVKELLWASDIFLFTTYQEGLPRSLSEAMAAGLPCLASKIRGNTDLMEDGVNGFLYSPEDVEGFAKGLKTLSQSVDLRRQMYIRNLERIKNFNFDAAGKAVEDVYRSELGGTE